MATEVAERMAKSRARKKIVHQVEVRGGNVIDADVIAQTEQGILWAWKWESGWTRLT